MNTVDIVIIGVLATLLLVSWILMGSGGGKF